MMDMKQAHGRTVLPVPKHGVSMYSSEEEMRWRTARSRLSRARSTMASFRSQ